jgi:putative acyl-CoA dehydrogenase
MTNTFKPSNAYWAETHDVTNRPSPLENYNAYEQDTALKQAVKIHGGGWAHAELSRFGAECGSSKLIELGFQANANKPALHTHDRHGKRVDEVCYHPAYHELMARSMEAGIHSEHWMSDKPAAHVVRAAKSYLITQVEAGHGCPITMTSAAIPSLKRQPSLYAEWAPKILASAYDQRNVSHSEKQSVTIGMAMTEKQGGSDVRQNSTRAYPVDKEGAGELYELVGHKYFVSAPMSDAFLVLAQTKAGVSCFLAPRWRPDGTKNPIQIQKLKNKMGNVSNASSETELRGALGWMVGEEGRGIAAILDMVSMTRFDCMIGSSAGMRQAVAQVTHHCAERIAFGRTLTEQPLMQNVLADLILESEAALAFTMRMARALDNSGQSSEDSFMRLGTAIGKYWICKRAPSHAYEAMECIGGMGVMEETIMPRLFRESPVNSIWEGSGNVQCLDMIRALKRHPESLQCYMEELSRVAGRNHLLDAQIRLIEQEFSETDNLEYRSRRIMERMALAGQAAALYQYSDEFVAASFCQARFGSESSGLVYGGLPTSIDCSALIERARPLI